MFVTDAASRAETERIAISRIADLEKELEFVKNSNKDLKKNYQDLETAGKLHDEELVALLDPIAKGLSGKQSDCPSQFYFDFVLLILSTDIIFWVFQEHLELTRYCPTSSESTP